MTGVAVVAFLLSVAGGVTLLAAVGSALFSRSFELPLELFGASLSMFFGWAVLAGLDHIHRVLSGKSLDSRIVIDDGQPERGQRLTLVKRLDIRTFAHPDAPWAGTIPAGTAMQVLTIQGPWAFIQTEDSRTEGWAEIVIPPG